MVFLDANVLIELVVPKRAHYEEVKKLLSDYSEVYMSTLSARLCWHFGRQAGVRDDLIASIVDSCTLLSLEPFDYYWARENRDPFANALINVAIGEKLPIITSDLSLLSLQQTGLNCIDARI